MNDPCPQRPVWGWTLSTDLHSETSVPLTPPITSHSGEWSRLGHPHLAFLPGGLKILVEAVSSCLSSSVSSTEHS